MPSTLRRARTVLRRGWTRASPLTLGVLTVAGLAVVDLVGTEVTGASAATNLSGTLVLAPAVTGVAGSRRDVLRVGALALVVGSLLAVLDAVPAFAGVVRCLVVVAGTLLVAGMAGRARRQQDAELQLGRDASRTLQSGLVGRLPEPDHLRLASRYLPASAADQVGGDWCDAVVDVDGCLTLLVGDVVGHDLRAAAVMGSLRDVLLAYAVEGEQAPSALLHRTEGALDRLGVDLLATASVVRIETLPGAGAGGDGGRSITWSSAGHPAPVLLRPDGSAELLETDPGLMLGVGFGPARGDQRQGFPVGSTLILYTDGLVEDRRSDLAEGSARLLRSVARHARDEPQELVDHLLIDLVGSHEHDDVVVLVVRADDEPALARGGTLDLRDVRGTVG